MPPCLPVPLALFSIRSLFSLINKDFTKEIQNIVKTYFFYRYGSLAKAAAKPDGLAVLGTFFHIQKEDNSVFLDLTKKLQQIQEPREISENLSGLSLASFIPPMDSKTTEFFRYEGSLTTPGCYESVTWTVFRHSLAISEEQMASFRALYDGQGQPLVNNFRPVQPLNGR